MVLAAHQPNYLPWAGYFHKMSRCDAFVFMDSVQYSRTSYTARCLVKQPDGRSHWLSVPVFKKGRYYQRSAKWRPITSINGRLSTAARWSHVIQERRISGNITG